MAAVTAAQLIQSVSQRFIKDKAQGISLTFHFIIKGNNAGNFTVNIANGQCLVSDSLHGIADCLVETDADTYIGLETGSINPQEALMQGRVKVSDLMHMLAFSKLFTKYQEHDTPANVSRGHRSVQNGPLSGVRIVDFTRLLPGPLATMFMAEMGAEVIKIEDTLSPDYIRTFPPFINGVSAYYLALNAGKYSVSVNFKQDKQRVIDIIKSADVLVEQYRPGVMDVMGFGYEAMRVVNPKLIYIAITGYGQHNSQAQLAGHDINYLAASGILGLNKDEKGTPVLPGFQLADVGGGSYLALTACTAALYERERTGVGKYISVSMANAVVPLLALPFASQQAQGHTITELGGSIANYNIYKCADANYIAFGALEPKFWAGFCQAVNKSEWQNRIADMHPEAIANLKADLQALFLEHPATYWEELGSRADVCINQIQNLDVLGDNAYLNETGAFNTTDFEGKQIKTVALPLDFGVETNTLPHAPHLGEDNNLF